MAQSVNHLTLDLSSGLDFRVVRSSPMLGSILGAEPIYIFHYIYIYIFCDPTQKSSRRSPNEASTDAG